MCTGIFPTVKACLERPMGMCFDRVCSRRYISTTGQNIIKKKEMKRLQR